MHDFTVQDCTQEQKIALTFLPSFDNANGHLCQEWFLRSWGPFLESPGNFSGPKSNIQIEI